MSAPHQIAQTILDEHYDDPNNRPIDDRTDAGYTEMRRLIELGIATAQQERTTVYIVQTEDGDVLDVTFNKEWADHLTRDHPDVPIRTLTTETAWDGPEDRSEWDE